jgi:hypothetical protein
MGPRGLPGIQIHSNVIGINPKPTLCINFLKHQTMVNKSSSGVLALY